MSDPPKPLTSAELEGLARWQRRMVGSFVAFMVLMGLALLLGLGLGVSDRGLLPLGVVMALCVLFGIYTQFSTRCPRCGRNLGFQSRLLLPRHCTKCGVAFKR